MLSFCRYSRIWNFRKETKIKRRISEFTGTKIAKLKHQKVDIFRDELDKKVI